MGPKGDPGEPDGTRWDPSIRSLSSVTSNRRARLYSKDLKPPNSDLLPIRRPWRGSFCGDRASCQPSCAAPLAAYGRRMAALDIKSSGNAHECWCYAGSVTPNGDAGMPTRSRGPWVVPELSLSRPKGPN